MGKKKKIKSKEIKGQLGKKKETAREKMIGQTIGYRYDVNLLPNYKRLTPFLKNIVNQKEQKFTFLKEYFPIFFKIVYLSQIGKFLFYHLENH